MPVGKVTLRQKSPAGSSCRDNGRIDDMRGNPVVEHDFGLQFDLANLQRTGVSRRRLLRVALAGSTTVLLGACAADDDRPDGRGTSTVAGSDGSCVQNPEETAGPFPGNGSNTVNGSTSNVLTESGAVRSDITSSFGTSTTVADGVQLGFTMTLGDVNAGCAPLEGYAVYVWHCTREGDYSLYSDGVQDENFLRGVQVSDASGIVRFQTIFPGCYPGRYPHIHFEVYPSLDMASSYSNKVQTSQIALERHACHAVYAGADGYAASARHLERITISKDSVFRNNSADEVAVMTLALSGEVSTGYSGSLEVAVPV